MKNKNYSKTYRYAINLYIKKNHEMILMIEKDEKYHHCRRH